MHSSDVVVIEMPESQILAIESLKAVLRLRILSKNHQGMQTNGERLVKPSVCVDYVSMACWSDKSRNFMQQELDKASITWGSYTHFCDERQRIQQQQYESMVGICARDESEHVTVHTGARSGIRLRVPASYATPAAANDQALQQQRLREKQLQRSLQFMWIGEVLHILRPVVYAALKYAMANRRHKPSANEGSPSSRNQPSTSHSTTPISEAIISRSPSDWVPWVVSLLMELVALYFTAMAIFMAQGAPNKAAGSSAQHRTGQAPDATQAHPFERELQRRKWLLAWYLLRSPLFETGVRPVLQAMLYVFGKTPLLGGLFRYVTNLPEYLHRHHFYTAGSS